MINTRNYKLISSVSTVYQQFKQGDIVFTRDYTSYTLTDTLTHYFNYSLAHAVIITEENGIKYVLNATPGHYDNYILKKYKYIGNWTIVKEPLLEFILKYKCMYQVFRHKYPKPIQCKLPSHPTYCSQFVGTLLYESSILPASAGILTPYTPERLIELLLEKGYRSFSFKHI